MSKTKKKLVVSIITMLLIIVVGDSVLAYLTYVIAHYAITEATTRGEWVVCALSMSLPILSVYLTALLVQDVRDDVYRLRWMK